MHKLIIVTAPSGAGKTTIVKRALEKFPQLAFSVSATSRARRPYEVEGVDYYFLTVEAFKAHIAAGDFLEYQEVYENQYYGTLKKEVERLWSLGKVVIFDVDVKGALNIKRAYPKHSLALFVKPPSPQVLYERLKNRNTESPESLQKRIAKAAEELTYEQKFDYVVLNEELERAVLDAETSITAFLAR